MNIIKNGLNINYCLTKTNENEPYVLFLHGFLGGIFSFKGLQDRLSSTFNTINLDLPSFGLSDYCPSSFSIYDYAKVVAEFLNKLNIKKVNIVSHSFGGRIAIILAANYKNLVNKVVLIDAAGIKPKFNLLTFLKIKYYKFLKHLVKIKLIKKEVLHKFGSSDYKQLNDEQRQVFNRVIKEDLSYLLPKILSPTLLIWGKYDSDTPLYMAKKIKSRVKDCGLVVLEAGHYSYLEEQFKVYEIMLSFFKESV